MKKNIIILHSVFFFLFLVSTSYGDVIYNNFGLGDTYNTAYGLLIGDDDWAMSFTPSGTDYKLTSIELAVKWINDGNQNKLDVWIARSSGNVPGNDPSDILESFHFIDAMESDFDGSILLGNSLTHPVLSEGTEYWLVASTPSKVTWFRNSTDDTGKFAGRTGLGPWSAILGAEKSAFRIKGTPVSDTHQVPEPSTLILLGSGLIGLSGFRKKFKKND